MSFFKFLWPRRRRYHAPEVRLVVEVLEGRQLPSGFSLQPVLLSSQLRNVTQPLITTVSVPSLDGAAKDVANATITISP